MSAVAAKSRTDNYAVHDSSNWLEIDDRFGRQTVLSTSQYPNQVLKSTVDQQQIPVPVVALLERIAVQQLASIAPVAFDGQLMILAISVRLPVMMTLHRLQFKTQFYYLHFTETN